MGESLVATVEDPGPSPRDEGWVKRAFLKNRRFRLQPAGATLIFGDSNAAQWTEDGHLEARGFPGVANMGIGGDRVQDMRWRLLAHPLTDHPPAFVIIVAGGNNLPHEPPELVVERLADLIKLVHRQAPAAHVVMIGILPRGPTLKYLAAETIVVNQALREIAHELGFRLVVANDILLAEGGAAGSARYYRDRGHLNETGFALLGRLVSDALNVWSPST